MIDLLTLSPELVLKIPGDTYVVEFDFSRQMNGSEVISSVGSVTTTPSSLTAGTPSITTTGKNVQIPISAGLPQCSFIGERDDDILTCTNDAYSEGDRVRVDCDSAANLPHGLENDVYYYVVNVDTNGFQLSRREGGPAVNLQTDGTGIIWIEYILSVQVTTDAGQTLTGSGRIWVRS